jgi:hypothetical protein
VARVYVEVSNQGIAASTAGERVIALYADATTGLPPLPGNFWSTTFPAGGGPCGALDSSTGWHLVDSTNPCQTIPVINPELPEVTGFTWNVPAGQAAHSCVLAIVESSDDPLNPAIRSTPLLDPNTLVPENRQISLRNLHIVDVGGPQIGSPAGAAGGGAPDGVTLVRIPNPREGRGPLEVFISSAGLGVNAQLSLILPDGTKLDQRDLRAVPLKMDRNSWRALHEYKQRPKLEYRMVGSEVVITGLPVPPGETWTVGLHYRVGPGRRNTAARFTVLTRQDGRVLGGSTFVLRH